MPFVEVEPVEALPPLPLPDGITSRMVQPLGIQPFHILEANAPTDPVTNRQRCILLLHGFPGLAFSWCRVMKELEHLGHHIIAPDLRGCGRTPAYRQHRQEDEHPQANGDPQANGHLQENGHSQVNGHPIVNGVVTAYDDIYTSHVAVQELFILVVALGHRQIACVVGHGIGALLASYCGLLSPLVQSVALLSRPLTLVPTLFGPPTPGEFSNNIIVHLELLQREKMHYSLYFNTPEAPDHLDNPPQGIREFLRWYFYLRSRQNPMFPAMELEELSASSLCNLPPFHIMPLGKPLTNIVRELKDLDRSDAVELTTYWFPERDLDVYVSEYTRTGFREALKMYRFPLNYHCLESMRFWALVALDKPCIVVSGYADWDMVEDPEAESNMYGRVNSELPVRRWHCAYASHWLPMEAPGFVASAVKRVLGSDTDSD